jgi:hypothetical protein
MTHRLCPVTSKRIYTSEHDAKRAAVHIRNRVRTYRCPHCKQLHLTNGEVRHVEKRIGRRS